ncbi:MAG: DUF2127 domain-containing protein [Pseudonocardia sp.]|nr:DUF2127 domain-containing protein [Pseudonocardia sp.]
MGLRYELLGCALGGHVLVGTDAKAIRPSDELVVRDAGYGLRWHRCLRCDGWLPKPVPDHPGELYPPKLTDEHVPPRGRMLRDRYVLRLIALDRLFHTVVLGSLAFVVVMFIRHREGLNKTFVQILDAVQGDLSGRFGIGLVHRIQDLFTVAPTRLWLLAAALTGYALLEGVEAVGLWLAKRWAEYLTFVATAVLLIPEINELVIRVTVFKVTAFVINLAVVVYLLWAKRLFGVRGGGRAEDDERRANCGVSALRSSHPFPSTQTAPSASAG